MELENFNFKKGDELSINSSPDIFIHNKTETNLICLKILDFF